MTDRALDAIRAWERGNTDKMTFMTQWQMNANYHLPNRADYLVQKWPGQKRMTYIFDAFPVWALEQHAAGLHSLLTSNALIWAYLRTYEERLNEDDGVRQWLNEASQVLWNVFSSPRHGFSTQSFEVFLDTGSIGSATMFCLESAGSGMLFSTRHMREIIWLENEEERIDGVIREWDWTARQAVKAWGDKAGAKVLDAYRAGNEQNIFKFLHAVRPRKSRDPQRADNRNMAWESLYLSVADKEEIAEGGFREFPAFCPRMSKCSGEVYGRGRCDIAQPDTQMLNEMVKLVLKGAQIRVNPVWDAPDDGYLLDIKTVPGAMNWRRSDLPVEQGLRAVQTSADTNLGVELLNALRMQIGRTFYVDKLNMPIDPDDPASEGKGITATYWLQRRDKEMMMISPMLSRMQAEFLGPAIDRVFAMLWRKSKARKFGPGSPFKPPPARLSGVPLRVEYVSPIALAQKSTQMDGVLRLLQIQQQLKQIDPNSQTFVDGEAILRLGGRDWNAPVTVLRNADELAQERAAKAQADAALHNTTIAGNLASAAADGTKAIGNLAAANANQQQEAA